jgi:RecA-family ATPase
MEELQTMTFDPMKMLVPGLIPGEGTTLICSKPKVGKSWLLLDLGLSATMDQYVLGELKAAQGDVLYLALEDSDRRLQARGTKLLPTFTGKWPKSLAAKTVWRRVDQGGLQDLREWVEEKRGKGRKVAFIAIDVLKMIRPHPQAGKQAYDLDYDAIVGLRQLSLELGVPILIAHHTRKAEAEDLIDKVSGMLGLTAAADAIIVIDRQSQGWVFDVRGRDIEADTFAVEFNKTTCRWTIGGDAVTMRMTSERGAVLAALEEATEPMGPNDIAAVTGMKPANVRYLLGRLWNDRAIKKVERGRYLPLDPSQTHNAPHNQASPLM